MLVAAAQVFILRWPTDGAENGYISMEADWKAGVPRIGSGGLKDVNETCRREELLILRLSFVTTMTHPCGTDAQKFVISGTSAISASVDAASAVLGSNPFQTVPGGFTTAQAVPRRLQNQPHSLAWLNVYNISA